MDFGGNSGLASSNTSVTVDQYKDKEPSKLQVNMNFVNIFNHNFDK